MEDYGPDIITVVDDDGEEHEFEVLDRIETDDDKKYIALLPVYENSEALLDDSGELIILEVIEKDGENVLESIEDDEKFDKIGAIFTERLSELYDFEDDTEE